MVGWNTVCCNVSCNSTRGCFHFSFHKTNVSGGLDTGSASSYASTVIDTKVSSTDSEIAVVDEEVILSGSGSDHHDEDDDEDGEDEIATATYYPHTTPSISRTPSSTNVPRKKDFEVEPDVFRRETIEFEPEPTRPNPRRQDSTSEFDLAIQKDGEEHRYHGTRRAPPSIIDDGESSGYQSYAESSGYSDSGMSDYDESLFDESESWSVRDEDFENPDVTPTSRKKSWGYPPTSPQKPHRPHEHHHHHSHHHHPPHGDTAPLNAVELKPYKHQVGGHTALFRFSKKAVCKSLSNKENEFYEAIETRHKELLKFLPK